MGDIKLEFKPGNKFAMNMMVPLEGSFTRNGRKLTLTVEKVAGVTAKEAKKDVVETGFPEPEADACDDQRRREQACRESIPEAQAGTSSSSASMRRRVSPPCPRTRSRTSVSTRRSHDA